MNFALVRTQQLDVEALARATGVHPDLLRRMIALGLLDAEPGPAGDPWLPPAAVHAVHRLQRLRAGLSLNYAALGVVVDLLDRIAVLEVQLRARPPHPGDRQWT